MKQVQLFPGKILILIEKNTPSKNNSCNHTRNIFRCVFPPKNKLKKKFPPPKNSHKTIERIIHLKK